MSSVLSRPVSVPAWVPVVENPDIRAYIAELGGYLTGAVPNGERDNFLEETLDHLETMVEMSETRDGNLKGATIAAIQSYGSPRKNAEAAIENWLNNQPRHPSYIVRRMGIANVYAFALFGCADLLYWVCLQLRVNLPSGSAFRLPWSPAEIRHYFPAPLPFPEPTLQYALLFILPCLIPFALGWLCGRRIFVNPHHAVYTVMMPIIVSSYIIGLLLLPVKDGLVFAVFQTFFWLPVGCLIAHFSSSLAWRLRQRKFGSAARTRTPR